MARGRARLVPVLARVLLSGCSPPPTLQTCLMQARLPKPRFEPPAPSDMPESRPADQPWRDNVQAQLQRGRCACTVASHEAPDCLLNYACVSPEHGHCGSHGCAPGAASPGVMHNTRANHVFECFQCGQTFRWCSNLLRHQRNHTSEKSFSCELCGQTFSLKDHLVQHHKVHAEHRSYVCGNCGKASKQKSNLLQHQLVHIEERPFFCTDCGKAFQTKENLSHHQCIHSGEKPYACAKYGKSFRWPKVFSILLKQHLTKRFYGVSAVGRASATWTSSRGIRGLTGRPGLEALAWMLHLCWERPVLSFSHS
ncbi:Zinc finger protein 707 [Sciurus carolinensis]|uniref:Zinc finger protein 707 n=1 Tax=Sciurus carolinensis TaxID=30640 RepID=A0AA41T3A8_SCICA|nr:Zinc finger protein 707 [Sciurus carolinensis]